MSKSYKPEVIADNTGEWVGNALRFASMEEADSYVKDLAWRWTSVRESRVVEVDEPVNYVWDWNTCKAVSLGAGEGLIAVTATRSNEVDPDQTEMALDDK